MLKDMNIYDYLFWAGLVISIIGILLLMAGGVSFQGRALRNKPAWDGHTKPLLRWGMIILVIGMAALVPGVWHLYNLAA